MAERKDFIKSFMDAQAEYLKSQDQASWDIMFINCQKTCEVVLANYARCHKLSLAHDTFIDYAWEAAIRIMNRYKKGAYKIEYLKSVCRFSLIDVMYNKKNQFEDSVTCYGLEDDLDAIFNSEADL